MGASTLQEDVREAHFFKDPISDFVHCEFSTLQVDVGAARALGGSGGWTLWRDFECQPALSKRRPEDFISWRVRPMIRLVGDVSALQ